MVYSWRNHSSGFPLYSTGAKTSYLSSEFWHASDTNFFICLFLHYPDASYFLVRIDYKDGHANVPWRYTSVDIFLSCFATLIVFAVSKVGDIRSDDENDAPDMGEEKEELEPEEKDSGSESNCSSGVGSDQRMRLSSLPGVRATIGRHRRESRRSVKSGEDSEHSVTTRSRLRRAQKSTQND